MDGSVLIPSTYDASLVAEALKRLRGPMSSHHISHIPKQLQLCKARFLK